MLTRSRRLLFAFTPALLLVVLLVSAELMLRWAVPSLSSPFATEVVQEGTTFLEINRAYLERYFPAGTPLVPELKPEMVRKAKDRSLFRVVCLGESSMFGVPYEMSATIPALVRRQLRHLYPDREIEVMNLAASAINTNVMLDMADDVLSLHPDVILLYTGHNEFYGPDGIGASWLERRVPSLTPWKYRLRDLRLVRLFQRLLGRFSRSAPGQEKNLMHQVSRGAEIDLRSPDAGRIFTHFERNLGDLLARFREGGVPVILSEVSSNMAFPPFASPPAAGQDRIASLLAAGKVAEARGALDSLRRVDSANALVEFWSGEVRRHEGDMAGAARLFDRARDLDLLKFRAPGRIDTIIRAEASLPGVVVVAADSLFRARSAGGITDTALFCEHLHPTVRGYDLLSRLFLRALMDGHLLPGGDPATLLPYDADSLAICWLDLAYGALSIRSLTGRWPFTHVVAGHSVLDGADSTLLAIAAGLYNRKTGWTEACLQLAEHAELTGNRREALRTLAALNEEHPRASMLRYLYGNALKGAGEPGAAAAQYRRCIALNPSYPYPRVDLGLLLINAGNFEEARSLLTPILETPQAPATLQATACYGLSAIEANEGHPKEAIRLVERSLRLFPSYGPARSLRARLLGAPER